ncbi:MAG: protein-L-isoaspartate(D-aspartate) O-methyltransferase [Hyphomicrobiaceae bacterium]|nr:protein-L-isoaspartate(D-aspartate) O-methyltransferase [Hyphomicrobiaceae bacterium]
MPDPGPDTGLNKKRHVMVERQLAGRGIRDERVLQAMAAVPRELFVPEGLREFAYEDSALPIEAGQTISQPYIVAQMLELAEIGPEDNVLEVGAGSGYAAAVMGRLARRVTAIERHEVLASKARERIGAFGCDNVEIVQGNGTMGWPQAAPYDAILVAAGGPVVPPALKQELKIGGRLIIPVSGAVHQVLTRIRRTGSENFDEESHGLVAFVPLVGAEEWPPMVEPEDGAGDNADRERAQSSAAAAGPRGFLAGGLPIARGRGDTSTIGRELRRAATAFDELAELGGIATALFGDRRIVMLGEATHGTAEFYDARTEITAELVARHGFDIVAVEADWSDAAAYNRIIHGVPPPEPALSPPFTRFPRWMWRNAEVFHLLTRLRDINRAAGSSGPQAGFYGLDIYGLSGSIEAVVHYLDRVDPGAAAVARERYACLTPWRSDPVEYARMAASSAFHSCEDEASRMLVELLKKQMEYMERDGTAYFDAEQNARVVAGAEEYYRTLYRGSAASWNLRDQHMHETLERLLDHHGPGSKAVVWAHNSHVGDARATEMGQVREEHNIGQLARQRWGDQAALIGFGTDNGTVAAATSWDGPMEIKRVRPARDGSYEACCRDSGVPAFLLNLTPDQRRDVVDLLSEPRLERAIGVIYRPETELISHYFAAELPSQFDAWIWFEETSAVSAVPAAGVGEERETYPFGL